MNSVQQRMQSLMWLANRGQLLQWHGEEVARFIQLASFTHGLLSNTARWGTPMLEAIETECERLGLDIYKSDQELDQAGLLAKYADAEGWGEHPEHTRAEWKERVAEEDTESGYWEWVAHNVRCDIQEARGEPLSVFLDPNARP